MLLTRAAAAAGTCLLLLACKPTARALAVNVDACEICRMVISDARYGGEVVLNTGRVRTFDSIECLASYVNVQSDSTFIREILVSDFDRAELMPLDRASFSTDGRGSPMGMGFVARSAGTPAPSGALSLTWSQVRALVRERPLSAQAGEQPMEGGHSH